MSFLFQLTSSLLYDLLFVIIIAVSLVTIFGSLAAREQKRSIRKLPTIYGITPNVARSWR
jgi:hypothetical protein